MSSKAEASSEAAATVRIDVWLWAARFFRSRSLSRQAIDKGRVHLNGATCKPSRPVQVGDQLAIRRGVERFEVEVLAVSARRGPASLAAGLYQESEDSRLAREAARSMAKLQRPVAPAGRPDKAARRALRELKTRH